MSHASRRIIALTTPVAIGALIASIVLGSPAGAAQLPVGLGVATSFSVLAGSGITNTGPTTVNGDIGSHPTPTIVEGVPGITYDGAATNHGGDATTQDAKADLLSAYNDAGSRLPNIAQDDQLGGELLTEGVYEGGATGLTGDLTLDFQGSDTTQFIFKLTALTTASDSNVVIQNPGPAGTEACRVVWRISSSATFGTETDFIGDVLVFTSITANTGADFDGRLLALNGAVTLDTNTIDIGSCATLPAVSVPPAGIPIPPLPTTTSTSTSTTTSTSTSTSTTSPAATSATTSTTVAVVAAPVDAPTPTTPAPPVTGQGQPVPPPGAPGTPVGEPPATPPGIPELPRTGASPLLAIAGGMLVLLGGGAVRVEHRALARRLH